MKLTPRINDDHFLFGSITGASLTILNLAHNIHPFEDLTEYHMSKLADNDFKFLYELIKPSIEPWSMHSCNEELWTIGVGTSIGHTQPTGPIMVQTEILIIEAFSINWFSASSIAACEVATFLKF